MVFASAQPRALNKAERVAAAKATVRLLKVLFHNHPYYASCLLVLLALTSLTPVGVLWVGKLIIDVIEHQAAGRPVPWNRLVTLIAIEFGLATVGQLLTRAKALVEEVLREVSSAELSARVMTHASCLDLAQLEDASTSDCLERAVRQIGGHGGTIGQTAGLVQHTLTAASTLSAIAIFEPWLLLLLLTAVLPAFLTETHLAERAYSLAYEWTAGRRMLEYLKWLATNSRAAKEVKLFGLSGFLVRQFQDLSDAIHTENRRLAARGALVSGGLGILGAAAYYAGYALIIYLTVAGHRSGAGRFTIGTLTFLAGSFRASRDAMQSILLGLSGLFERGLYAGDLFHFLDLRSQMVAPRNGGCRVREIRSGLVFEHVTFRYPGSQAWAIRDVSFEVKPRERVALVGENGVGKSTLAKLIARLYDPTDGRILLDGLDLRHYDPESLRSAIGVVFQDFVRYDLLFKDNIAVGQISSRSNRGRISRAAELALADRIAERLPKGYEQQLGRWFPGGVDLSGGEWQKVAVARAYIRDARLLILDEPTAALDARAEYELFRRFLEISLGRLSFIISHRFSTARAADRIIVLQGGTVSEDGTHTELLARRGLYAELFNLQAERYR